MSSASSLLYYLGLNSIDDEVSRLNNSSSVPSSSFAPPSNATQNSHAVTPAGSQPGAPSVVAGISNNASSPESSTRIEQHSARVAITRILKEPQNQQLAPVAQSTSNNNINKTTNERTCNFCGNYGANARCSACQSAFYVSFLHSSQCILICLLLFIFVCVFFYCVIHCLLSHLIPTKVTI